MSETDRERIPQQRRAQLSFVELSGAYWGDGADHRAWHVKESSAGWQLEFFDAEDEEPVLAGTYPTADDAKRRAGVGTGAGRQATAP